MKEDHYLPIDRDPPPNILRKLLAEMKTWKAIDQETKDYLAPLHVRTSKILLGTQDPQTRKPWMPNCISSCGAPTEKISHFVDYRLHSRVETLPSFIKDTTDFVSKLQSLNNIPEGT